MLFCFNCLVEIFVKMNFLRSVSLVQRVDRMRNTEIRGRYSAVRSGSVRKQLDSKVLWTCEKSRVGRMYERACLKIVIE